MEKVKTNYDDRYVNRNSLNCMIGSAIPELFFENTYSRIIVGNNGGVAYKLFHDKDLPMIETYYFEGNNYDRSERAGDNECYGQSGRGMNDRDSYRDRDSVMNSMNYVDLVRSKGKTQKTLELERYLRKSFKIAKEDYGLELLEITPVGNIEDYSVCSSIKDLAVGKRKMKSLEEYTDFIDMVCRQTMKSGYDSLSVFNDAGIAGSNSLQKTG